MRKRKSKKSRRRAFARRIKIAAILCVCLIVLGVAAVGFFGYKISTSEKTLPNVWAGDIDLSNQTYDEVIASLEAGEWAKKVGGTLTVNLPKNVSFSLDYLDAGVSVDAEAVAAAAMEYGHSENWLESLDAYLSGVKQPHDVSGIEGTIDDAYIESSVQSAVASFHEATKADGYKIDEENSCLLFVKGAGEMKIDAQDLNSKVRQALTEKQTTIEYSAYSGEAGMPDFSSIYNDIHSQAADAYYDFETDSVVKEIRGLDFSVENAAELWNKAGNLETVKIPITLTEPNVTAEELEGLLFRDLLGEQMTNYFGSTENRINNIKLASSFISGTILMPGDVFSYNETVGQRTEAAGFKPAGAYADGQVVQEVGGGICQVSSTLYAAMLRANLETVQRSCHQFVVTYLPFGIDATVSWQKPDFKFANNTEYPIKIIIDTNYDERSITVQIWGTNLTGNYCEPVSTWWTRNDDVYTDTIVGWGASCYRYIYDKDGNLLDKVFEASSIYDLHSDEIQWPPEYYETEDTNSGSGDSTVVIPPAETPAPQVTPSPAPEITPPPTETSAPEITPPPETTPAPQPDPEPDPEPDPQPDPQPDPEPAPQPDPEPAPQPETQSDSQPASADQT